MKLDALASVLHKSSVIIYRTVGVLILYSILLFVASYAILMGFYALNHSWCAPLVLTASEDKILALTQQIISSDEAIGTLTFARDQSTEQIVVLGEQRKELADLRLRLDREIPKEVETEQEHKITLDALDADKINNDAASDELVGQVTGMRIQVAQDLASGLITKTDATSLLSVINQTRVSATDEKIGEIVLQDAALQKDPNSTTWLSIQSQRAALSIQIAQIDIALKAAVEQVGLSNREISELELAVSKAKSTPYFRASQEHHSVYAFVPYANSSVAVAGSRVYDCYLSMVICKQVGVVAAVFSDEEQTINPVLQTPVRGFLVQLSLKHEESARSKTLMLGRKPLFF